ncbi:MAG: O-antigen ligase family protein [Acidimicrobiia bacterium]|nr:O-antigen ligase family protein [Acidimicrobiia bacterium]
MSSSATSWPGPVSDVDHAAGIGRSIEGEAELVWWLTYLVIVAGGLLIAAVAYLRPAQIYLGFSLACLAALLLVWIRAPKLALAATIVLSLVGDQITVYWFPFTKNLSSGESLMYVAGAISLSPFEVVVVAALALTTYRNLAAGRLTRPAPLLRPMVQFTTATLAGLALGLQRGGDVNAALFEVRPVLYLPALYLLVVNVCEDRHDYRRMVWAAVAGITVQSVLSVEAIWSTPLAERAAPESIMEHGSAISMNLGFVLLVATLVYNGRRPLTAAILLVAAVPMLIAYFASERRAAVVALVAGMIVLAIVLRWRQPATLLKVAPLIVLPSLIYVAAMWSSESSAAFPAQALKSVVSPGDVSDADRGSSEYRELENFDLHATIRSSPVTGIGFGHPFLRPAPLPDISQFEYHEFVPHNSLLWVWTKAGFVGFATLLYLVARSLTMGAERMRRIPDGIDAVIAYAAVSFVVMFTIFMYVDIAWGPRNAMLLALCMGLCTAPLRDDPVSHRRPAVESTATTSARAASRVEDADDLALGTSR